MSTTGPNSGSVFAEDSSVGTIAWADVGNAVASDDVYAVALVTALTTSRYLKATGFGFAVPAGGIITDVKVEVEGKRLTGVVTPSVKLVKGGTISGSARAPAAFDATDAYKSTNASPATWGVTLLDTDVNAAGFGCVVSCAADATGATVSIDHIRITITYLLPVITAITPASGANNASALSITNLAGTDLAGATPTVKLTKTGETDISATSVVQVSATQVTCTFNIDGATPGTWNVVYTDASGTSTLSNGFTVTLAPLALTSVSPSAAPNSEVLTLLIAGYGFAASGMTAWLSKSGASNRRAFSIVRDSSTRLTCKIDLRGLVAGSWTLNVSDGTTTVTL